LFFMNPEREINKKKNSYQVVNIAYTNEFREAMDFFRGVLATGEKSKRVLALTKRIISFNPANYTAWHLRRTCLFELGESISEEMIYVQECAENSPKNYQVWYHRRALVERLNDGTAEPQFVSQILSNTDSKNYHAWAHRQWALKRFQIWEGELEYAEYLIKEDIRNNSAWNHRWYVLTEGGFLTFLELSLALREIQYAMDQAEIAPSNECPYNYIRAVCSKSNLKLGDDQIVQWMQASLERSTGNLVHLRSLYIDSLIEQGLKEKAVAMCVELADRYDSIRVAYWRWRAATIMTT
jgi:protein farnesyltransferase/geranylgeranyltransferase type-1 subunit alpha